jgi:hypothetical protein
MVDVLWYENRTMKPVEIVLRRGKREIRENDVGVNLIKVYCKHICKCHDVPSPVQLLYANKKAILSGLETKGSIRLK